MDLTNKTIGVLLGGTSAEREISLISGLAVSAALKPLSTDDEPAMGNKIRLIMIPSVSLKLFRTSNSKMLGLRAFSVKQINC